MSHSFTIGHNLISISTVRFSISTRVRDYISVSPAHKEKRSLLAWTGNLMRHGCKFSSTSKSKRVSWPNGKASDYEERFEKV